MQLKCPYCKDKFPPQDNCKCPKCGKFVNIPQHLRPSFQAPKRKKTSREEREERIRQRTLDTGFSGKVKIAALALIAFLILGTIQILTKTSSQAPAASKRDPHASKIRLAEHQLVRIRTALEFYKLDCYRYPPPEMGLTALVRPLDVFTWNGPYVMNMRLSDPWVIDYVYDLDEEGNVVLYSCGPDRRAGTEDDVMSPPPFPLEKYDPSLKKETPQISIVHEEALEKDAPDPATNDVAGALSRESSDEPAPPLIPVKPPAPPADELPRDTPRTDPAENEKAAPEPSPSSE